ncbi:MAG: S41 family peptidase [Clostridium sp.]|nr:S41 family peptidase [Prevotella sp.]MCM1429745.1 S41 family peptidase [Clostridium sp.]
MKLRFLPILALTAAGVAVAAGAVSNNTELSHDMAFQRNITLFNALAKTLEESYVDSIRTDEAFEAAIAAMLNTVDPYTEYYTAEDKAALSKMTTGSYGGIGSYILTHDGATYLSEPIEGSPAHNAGLRAGDKILKVDSVSALGLPGDKVSAMLKGQPGTTVTVSIFRPFVQDSLQTVTIVREKVHENSVPYYSVVGNTGYVRLTSFIDDSPAQIEKALQEFKSNPAVKNVVLDLRGNGGGLVESAVDIVGFFVPKGTEVLRTRGKDSSDLKIYKTTKSPILPDMPLAVLIDGGSASASEIVAGSLQDLDRAVLLGTNSYGKGLVQGTRELPYDALLKVTLAKYYIPSGRLIQALDYSRRNTDGTVARTPDSLTHVFKTLHGREVRDGGGLKPDSVLNWRQSSRLLYDLVGNNRIFDYATEYAAKNPTIGRPEEFEISDEVFADFVAHLDTTMVKADRAGLELLKTLRETADSEGYASKELTALMDSMQPLLEPDLQRDLYAKREDISELLASEIVSRYYFARGRAANELRTDIGLRAAREILDNPARYRKILNIKK